MKIQLNTDDNIDGSEALAAHVISIIEHSLQNISGHLTRVEVHLSDENGSKTGPNDHRCMLEARLEGRRPVVVTENADTLERAIHGAADKLGRLIESTLGRLHDHREKTSDLPLAGTEPTHLRLAD